MKKIILVMLMISALALLAVPFVLADDGACPDGFTLHPAMVHKHPDGGNHLHVGVDGDLNGDGYICGKHVSASGSVHVHIDNNAQIP